jgi:hypothetical protein
LRSLPGDAAEVFVSYEFVGAVGHDNCTGACNNPEQLAMGMDTNRLLDGLGWPKCLWESLDPREPEDESEEIYEETTTDDVPLETTILGGTATDDQYEASEAGSDESSNVSMMFAETDPVWQYEQWISDPHGTLVRLYLFVYPFLFRHTYFLEAQPITPPSLELLFFGNQVLCLKYVPTAERKARVPDQLRDFHNGIPSPPQP